MLKAAVRTLLAALVLSVLSTGASPFAHANKLRIGGTGAALGTMRILADAFMRNHPSTSIEILPSLGSGGGIKALAAGSINLAVSSRELKDDERAKGLRSQAYGKTAVVYATPSSNTVTGVTGTELTAIFSGTQITWSNGDQVRPILRPKVETDTKLAESHIPGMREAHESARGRSAVPLYFTDQEAASALERIPGFVGTMSLSLIISEQRQLKALALDGHVASPQSIADDSYPITKTLCFVLPAKPNQVTKDFFDFAFSEEGRAILENTGHQALPRVTG
jgi:phosphate transport system substrate-binding protein